MAAVPWLMRAWRLAGPDLGLRRQVDLIAALKTRPGVRSSLVPGTLTRYETGELVPPHAVVEAMEHVVGLAPGEIGSHLAQPVGLALDRAELWDLLGRADASGATSLSGADWIRLAQQLVAPTGGNLQSPSVVAGWAQSVVTEMAGAIGAPYRLRMRAIDLMARDPLVGGPLADSVTSHLEACGYTVIGDALGALTDAGHPKSATIAIDTYRRLDGAPLRTAAMALSDEVRRNAIHTDRWQSLRATLIDDLTDDGADRQEAAAIVASGLSGAQQSELTTALPKAAVVRLRDALVATRSQRPSPELARDLRRHCELLAVRLLGDVNAKPFEGLTYWLRRGLLNTFDLEAALVLGSSPFADGLSRELLRIENPATKQPSDRQFPGASVVINTCLRTDSSDLVAEFQAGTVADRQRLLVPLAHHRALPADLDLAATAAQVGSTSRVLYAAGMSGHPGLQKFSGTLTGHEKQAGRWWVDTSIATS